MLAIKHESSKKDFTSKFNDSSIMKKAKCIAEKSEHMYQLGAVIFDKNKIISYAENKLRYNAKLPEQFREWYCSLHAEQAAIIKARTNISGMSMLVIRLRKDREFGLAKPCPLCEGFAKFNGLKYIYYTTNEGTIERMKL
jgi:deoxycytidylate deaminase